jgi:hypothetical protein
VLSLSLSPSLLSLSSSLSHPTSAFLSPLHTHTNTAGRSKGWGIVEFETPEEVRQKGSP